jgi:hypothetical protein
MSRWALFFKATLQFNKWKGLVEVARLPLFFLMAVGIVLFMANGNATAEVLLFQSPQEAPPTESPPAEPTATPLPPPIETPVPVEAATSEPVTAPTEELVPLEANPVEEIVTEEIIPLEPVPTEEPVIEQATDNSTLELTEGAVPPGPQPRPISLNEREEEVLDEAEGGPRNFILNRAQLIDTVAISGAYLWLCCGIGLLLFAPLSLLLLYVRGRSKIIREDNW